MRLRVTHETRYDYTPVVETAHHLTYLRPLVTTCQSVQSHTLRVSPQPDHVTEVVDVFGNTRTFFSLQVPHKQLSVLACSEVETRLSPVTAVVNQGLSWDQSRDMFRYRAHGDYESAAEFIFSSPWASRHPDFLEYARLSFAPGESLLACLRHLMTRIHTDFTYSTQSTEVNTPAREALALRKGVCQDFSHIMIACLRSLGLPARYISGYLLTEPPPGQPRLIGADASHAWVSAYVPNRPLPLHSPEQSEHPSSGGDWFHFCPTNNRWGLGSPGIDYVTLAIGRDFGDVSPMRGMIHGGTSHHLSVGVTVQPMDAA